MVRLFIMVLLFYPVVAWSGLTARFDRDTLRINESVRLVIETDSTEKMMPDVSAVEKHFEIISQATSQNVSIVGGNRTVTNRFIYELEPKAVGSFSISPITFGVQQTEVMRVSVLPAATSAEDNAELFIEESVDQHEIYVQEQLILTLRLFLSVRLLDGSLADPAPASTRVERLGEDRRYTVNRNNREYSVYERRYALFPQQSGSLTVPPVRFEGIADDQSSGAQVFGSLFNQGRRISARSAPIVVAVRPPPAEFTGSTWLPASQLQIDEVGDIVEQVEIGQPLTRKIQVQARGLTAEQLPAIDFGTVDGVRFYPDKPVSDTAQADDSLLAIQQSKVAIIGAEPGEVSLPPVRIDWWDTGTDTQQTAILPSRQVRFAGSSVATVGNSTDPAPQPAADAMQHPGEDAGTETIPATEVGEEASSTNFWRWAAFSAFGLWIVTLVAILVVYQRFRKTVIISAPADKNRDPDLAALRNKLRSACADGDPRAARAALLDWVKQSYGAACTLVEFARRQSHPALANEILALDQHLYASDSDSQDWSGDDLWNEFKRLAPPPRNDLADRNGLIPLYPRKAVA